MAGIASGGWEIRTTSPRIYREQGLLVLVLVHCMWDEMYGMIMKMIAKQKKSDTQRGKAKMGKPEPPTTRTYHIRNILDKVSRIYAHGHKSLSCRKASDLFGGKRGGCGSI